MSFKDIRGQNRAIDCLRNSVNRDRLAHAYLFLGPAGLGKTMLAKETAKFLNCQSPLKDNGLLVDCCQRCISCRKIDNLNHPDIHWIRCEGVKNISIDQIRAVQQKIYLKAYEGKFKVCIILEAQQMSEEAANSLLKTLEEPPAFSIIILTSTNISGLLPTMISRCQIIKFYPLSAEGIKGILTGQYNLSPAEAQFLSAQSEGRIGRALDLKQQDALSKKNRLIDRIGQLNRGLSAADIFNTKDKRQLAEQMGYLLNWFRDILIFKTGLSGANIINADRMQNLESWARRFRFEELEQIIANIDQTHRLIEQNLNPKIALEVMLRGISKCKR